MNRETVLTCLDRVVESSEFEGSHRAKRFLRFCVESWLAGQSPGIKESTIGVAVFDLDAGYDPKLNPIVRVSAGRLRQKLEQYYSNGGSADAVRFEIPKGTYVPIVHWRSEATTTPPAPRSTYFSQYLPLIRYLPLMMTVAIVVAAILLYLAGNRLEPQVNAGGITPLISLPGKLRNPAWSRDGSVLAFSWEGPGETEAHIYVQAPGNSDPVRQTQGKEPEFQPVFGPDASEIAFLRRVGRSRFQVVIRNRTRGSERVVAELNFCIQVQWMDLIPALDWSPDGKYLVASQWIDANEPASLLLIDAATGKTRQLTNPPAGGSGDLEARFSPDNRLLAVKRGGLGDAYIIRLHDGKEEPLTTDNPGVSGLDWTADGRSILFGSRRSDGEFGIFSIDLTSRARRLVTPQAWESSIEPRIRPGGSGRVAMLQRQSDSELVEISLRDGRVLRRFASSTREEHEPVFSPDQSQVAFMSSRSGSMELWIANRDGGGLRRLTSFAGRAVPAMPVWCAAGKQLVISVRDHGKTELEQVEIDHPGQRQIRSGGDRRMSAQCSPDGAWIYFHSNAGGRQHVRRMSTNDGHEEVVVGEPTIQFRLSSDGREVYYVPTSEPPRLKSRTLASGVVSELFQFPECPPRMAWQVMGRNLYFVQSSSPHKEAILVEVNLENRHSRMIGNVGRAVLTWPASLSIAPDGKTALMAVIDHERTEISWMPDNKFQ